MPTPKIRILDEHTINQIAAGEVIENPASVVKELIENALDSGACEIKVETIGGGRGLIKVWDDGCGMSVEDLSLALQRHATSKLCEFEDLNSLLTLGFRGEALPSIASVSKLSIHTADGTEGCKLYTEGGKDFHTQPFPRLQGTTVEVKSLFFNVPVRKKFQKSAGWDRSEIHKVLTKSALGYQDVGFSWICEGKQHFNLSAEMTLKKRIEILLGETFSQSMFPIKHHEGAMGIKGFSSHPSFHRPNRTGQYLFINGRAVFSSFISEKILEGYGTRLSTHRYPLFVLNLILPPSLIDSNVHPQKIRVRLRKEQELASFLIHAIEKCFVPVYPVSSFSMPSTVVCEPKAPYVSKSMSARISHTSSENLSADLARISSSKCERSGLAPATSLFPPSRQVVAKVGKYLFVEDLDGIRVIDSRRAFLRISYEQLVQKEKKKAIQQLLLPLQIEVTGAEKIAVMEHLTVFEQVGVSLRHFGENTFVIDAMPACFEKEQILSFIHAFLEKKELSREKMILTALHKSVRTYIPVDPEWIVEALFQCEEPGYTPDGKPIHYLLTEKELESIITRF